MQTIRQAKTVDDFGDFDDLDQFENNFENEISKDLES